MQPQILGGQSIAAQLALVATEFELAFALRRLALRLRVIEVTRNPNDEEPIHHHRWPSIFVLDQIKPPIVDISPDGECMPPNRDVIKALESWDGQGSLVVHMAPQPAGRVLSESDLAVHGIRIEMKTN